MNDDRPDLFDASDTDEVNLLAYKLTAWGLRNGECTEHTAVDWLLEQPRPETLPRGSRGIHQNTLHHVRLGARKAVEKYDPTIKAYNFDAALINKLRECVAGSGCMDERYLLGALDLCDKYQTYAPVITGPLLAQVTGVSVQAAGKVLSRWRGTMAHGFFSEKSYDGQRGHGTVFSVNLDWLPVMKFKHLPGCNRAKARCDCLSQSSRSIFVATKIDKPNCDTEHAFRELVETGKPRDEFTIESVTTALAITRAAASKLLRKYQDCYFSGSSIPADRRRRTAETWIRGYRDNGWEYPV